MHVLTVIHDSDIGSNAPAPAQFVERMAARAVVFDAQNNVALLHATNKGYHKLPGGGVEAGESVEEALAREMAEEIGCMVTNLHELGIIEEYRNAFALHQTSYCFVADLVGAKGEPNLEADEIADGFVPVWMPIAQAIQTLQGENNTEPYESPFIRTRDLLILQHAALLRHATIDARK